ncbi:AzlC family ABC transporter permease [Streptomyces sp. NPDC056796]|uniref:AzlC family ABC transporter permease n=1 Tax=unclassified Streptomyces TaxID=2593676 RepID=UPI0036889178
MERSPAVAGPGRPLPGPQPHERSPAYAALRDCASVGLGMIPLGLAFGALAVRSGLDWWWAGLSAALVYGGSFEFLLIGSVVAVTPLASIAVAAFLVNARHVFYALSFPLDRVRGRLGKTYSTFALTDEAYALTATERSRTWSGPHILRLQFFMHVYWAGSALAGGLLGSLIPHGVTGLDFALTALFAVLALDAVRDLRGDLPTPVLALLGAVAALLLFPGQMLLAAFVLFTAGLLVRHLVTRRKATRV